MTDMEALAKLFAGPGIGVIRVTHAPSVDEPGFRWKIDVEGFHISTHGKSLADAIKEIADRILAEDADVAERRRVSMEASAVRVAFFSKLKEDLSNG